jgi:chromosome segregation ATPase
MSKINVSLIKSYGMALYVKVTIPDQIDIKPKTKVHVEYSQSGYLYYTWVPIVDSFDDNNSVIVKNLIPSTSYVFRCKWTDKSNVEQFSDVSEYMVTLSEADDAKLKASETLSELISVKKELEAKNSKLEEIEGANGVLQLGLSEAQAELSSHLAHHSENIALIKEKEQKISELSRQNSVTSAAYSKLTTEHAGLAKLVCQYEKELIVKTKERDELRKLFTEETTKQHHLENTITEKHGEIMNLNTLIASTKVKLDKYSSDIVTLNHQINKQAIELLSSKTEITNLLQQKVNLESKIVDLEKKIKELTIELEESNTKSQDLEVYRKKFDDVTEEKYKLIDEIGKHQETEIHNAELLREIKVLHAKILETESLSSDLSRQIENLEQNRKIDISDLVDARKLILKQGNEKFHLSSSISDLKKQLDESTKSMRVAEDKYEEIKVVHGRVCADLIRVSSINEKLEESISEYKYEIDGLSSEIFNISAELDKYEVICSNLKAQINNLNAQINGLTKELLEKTKENVDLASTLVQYECDLEDNAKTIDELTEKLSDSAKMSEEINILRNKITKYEEREQLICNSLEINNIEEAITKYQTLKSQKQDNPLSEIYKLLGTSNLNDSINKISTMIEDSDAMITTQTDCGYDAEDLVDCADNFEELHDDFSTLKSSIHEQNVALCELLGEYTHDDCLNKIKKMINDNNKIVNVFKIGNELSSINDIDDCIDSYVITTDKLECVKSKLDSLCALVGGTNYENAIDALSKSESESYDRVHDLENQCAGLESECSDLHSRVDDLTEECSDLRNEVNDLEEEKIVLQKKYNALEDECGDLENGVEDLHNQIDELKIKTNELQCELDSVFTSMTEPTGASSISEAISIYKQQSKDLKKASETFIEMFKALNVVSYDEYKEKLNKINEIVKSIDIEILPYPEHYRFMSTDPVNIKQWAANHFPGDHHFQQLTKILADGEWKNDELNSKIMHILTYWINTYSWGKCAKLSKILHLLSTK